MRRFPQLFAVLVSFLQCGLLSTLLARAQQAHSSTVDESGTEPASTIPRDIHTDSTRDERFKALKERLNDLARDSKRSWSEYEKTARDMIKEFPDRPDGYDATFNVMQLGDAKRARSLAQKMMNSSAPEEYRSWAKGFLYRLDSFGKPVELDFKALDGREVDLSKMKGKVVLIDFWSTGCVPCVAALPEVKAVYEKYHARGFEVIGIAFDTDKEHLVHFVEQHGLPWPESFEGQTGLNNRFGRQFGVRAIPHILLIDKMGCLAFDSLLHGRQLEGMVVNLLARP